MYQQKHSKRGLFSGRISTTVASLAFATTVLTGCASQQTVILATHDSFAISDELVSQFEQQSGYQLEIVRLGDTGSLVSRLALTVSAPIADVYYGIDNTFMQRARSAQLIEGEPTAINFGDVCFNYDLNWFETNGVVPPDHWQQLASPEYAPLTVIADPRISSPGKAFLLSTGEFFESQAELVSFWGDLQRNGVRVAASWEDAYFLDFSRYGGDRPIVLSYASSPAAEIDDSGNPQTIAIRNDCMRQVEYAGVLPNAANNSGAVALIDFMQSESFQSQLLDLMYVYPVSKNVELDDSWQNFAPPATSFFTVPEGADDSELIAVWEQVFGR